MVPLLGHPFENRDQQSNTPFERSRLDRAWGEGFDQGWTPGRDEQRERIVGLLELLDIEHLQALQATGSLRHRPHRGICEHEK